MKCSLKICAVALLIVSVLSSQSQARTWRVERDGSGDFRVIQDAIDVAASGDTIQIGPGRFDDKQLFGVPPWQQYVRAVIVQPNLTIIGAGAANTFIGPNAPWTEAQGEDKGIYFDANAGAGVLRVRDLAFENALGGIYAANNTDSLFVTRCTFGGAGTSIYSFSDVTTISSCRFLSLNDHGGYHVNSIGQESIGISNSEFTIERQTQRIKICANIQSTGDARICGSEFHGGMSGISVSSGNVEIRQCNFDGSGIYGLTLNGGVVLMEDCVMRNQDVALDSGGPGGVWKLDRVDFEGIHSATLTYGHLGGGYIRNCTLARGMRYVVQDYNTWPVNGGTPITLDMSGNWWGTTNPDSIQAWIYDSNDQPARPYYYVQWQPCLTEPLGVQRRSLGGVKAMFR